MPTRVKLVRNGNSTAVNIPRAFVIHFGWLSGEELVCELAGDRGLLLRRVEPADFNRNFSPFPAQPPAELLKR